MSRVPSVAPFGTWQSPISAHLAVERTVHFVEAESDAGHIYWIEERAQEDGRAVVMHESPDGSVHELPPPWSARSSVYGQGGGAITIHQGILYFVAAHDQRIYRVSPGLSPVPVTAEGPVRFGGLVSDPHHNRLIAVREVLTGGRWRCALVSIDSDPSQPWGRPLLEGGKRLSRVALSPDGTTIAWIQWPESQDPRSSSALMKAAVGDDGGLSNPMVVSHTEEESVGQPLWSPDNHLFFLSDKNGWWNLYEWDGGMSRPVTALHSDFGDAGLPLAQQTYTFLNAERLIAAYWLDGRAKLVSIDRKSREMSHLPSPFSAIFHLKAANQGVLVLAAQDQVPGTVSWLNISSQRYRTVRRAPVLPVDEGEIAVAEPVTFPLDNRQLGHAFYYPPRSADYIPPEGEDPPVIVRLHPRSQGRSDVRFLPEVHFWTTRGFAVVDFNYRGSTGYGRAYRIPSANPMHDLGALIRFLARHHKADCERVILHGFEEAAALIMKPSTSGRGFRTGSIMAEDGPPTDAACDLPMLWITPNAIQTLGAVPDVGTPTEHLNGRAQWQQRVLESQLRLYAQVLGIRLPLTVRHPRH
ncbi:prolyl oligopeptidase family serine peptidase [Sulfobacillus harzensis]|uniref:Prolyl oligopeptidase family serine peptidase n=1 Tax=Sulfobacillus harzensis TaxID=2729629 RepID=A0A7Y0Q4L6_9FIRM|nr:prolyl oligopeptidase family serine peptidase [Sulfobacillus harzensis]NMP24545.1 prolyl oligopeptidase family serine peptidase [Sulfobacillus harzensis]